MKLCLCHAYYCCSVHAHIDVPRESAAHVMILTVLAEMQLSTSVIPDLTKEGILLVPVCGFHFAVKCGWHRYVLAYVRTRSTDAQQATRTTENDFTNQGTSGGHRLCKK